MALTEIGRAVLKSALARATVGNEGAKLVGSVLSGVTGASVQDILAGLKTQVDDKLASAHAGTRDGHPVATTTQAGMMSNSTHASLDGLTTGDPHSQYDTPTRGAALYAALSHVGSTSGHPLATSTAAGLMSAADKLLAHTRNHNLFASDHPDVQISPAPLDGHALIWNVAAGKWISASPAAVAGVPPGVLFEYAASTAPQGYLLCNGQAVSRTTFAALYAALGGASSVWGQGDLSTTFNVPDHRGRVGVGAGTGTGLTNRALAAQVGAESHLLTVPELPGHSHNVAHSRTDNAATGGTAQKVSSITASGAEQGLNAATSTSPDTAHPNMQPSIVLQFIIKT